MVIAVTADSTPKMSEDYNYFHGTPKPPNADSTPKMSGDYNYPCTHTVTANPDSVYKLNRAD